MTERDETIRAGDLVQVIKPSLCCNDKSFLGKVYEVDDGVISGVVCSHCGARSSKVKLGEYLSTTTEFVIERSRVVKLHPPEDEETEVTENELELA